MYRQCALLFAVGLIAADLPGNDGYPGTETSVLKHPYQVIGAGDTGTRYSASIQYLGKQVCEGVLLNTKAVLTAALCIPPKRLNISQVDILCGDDRSRSYPSRHWLVHPEFVKERIDLDMGVYYLQSEITLAPSVQPIRVVSKDKRRQLRPGDMLTTTAWVPTKVVVNEDDGPEWVDPGKSTPQKLYMLRFPVLDKQLCSHGDGAKAETAENMICAARIGSKFNKDVAGGAVVNDDNELVGIIPWRGFATGYPSLFVDYYYAAYTHIAL